jgi:hypothetical protein
MLEALERKGNSLVLVHGTNLHLRAKTYHDNFETCHWLMAILIKTGKSTFTLSAMAARKPNRYCFLF